MRENTFVDSANMVGELVGSSLDLFSFVSEFSQQAIKGKVRFEYGDEGSKLAFE